MPVLVKGQKVDLTKADPSLATVKIGLGWDVKNERETFDLDAVALLVDGAGKLKTMNNLVFYNNLTGPGNSVRLSKDNRSGAGAGDDEEIVVDLKNVPADISKIIVAIAIYKGSEKKQDFGSVVNPYARVVDEKNGKELYRYDLGHDFQGSTTVVLGEIYLHNGEWKFAATGNGLKDGVEELLSLYQFKVDPSALVKAPAAPQVAAAKPAAPVAPKAGGINLSKIELKKSGDKISLTKTDKPLGEIIVNLNWSQADDGEKKKSFASLFAPTRKADLDLGCFYEMEDGSRGVVQALGKTFGDFNGFPYINLDQDDRTGANKGGENLRINGNKATVFKRILVFAFIYEGVANWSQIDGVVTMKQKNGPDIEVLLDDHRNGKAMCAVALFENKGGQEISVKKVAKYYTGHAEMDKAFKWGMRWTAGSK